MACVVVITGDELYRRRVELPFLLTAKPAMSPIPVTVTRPPFIRTLMSSLPSGSGRAARRPTTFSRVIWNHFQITTRLQS